jgi:hypothetical protein
MRTVTIWPPVVSAVDVPVAAELTRPGIVILSTGPGWADGGAAAGWRCHQAVAHWRHQLPELLERADAGQLAYTIDVIVVRERCKVAKGGVRAHG